MKPSQCRPSKPAVLLPLGFMVFHLALFTGVLGADLSLRAGVLIHYVSFLVLGLAFEVPELSLNVFCLWISGDGGRFARYYPRMRPILSVRYVLTHFIAPCSGISVMASGLFLVHEGGYSFATGWLFWIMMTATFGLYKGMYQHNLFIRRLRAFAGTEEGPKKMEHMRRALRSPVDHALIFLEFPTYAFNYAAAYYQWSLANPWSGPITRMDTAYGATVYAGLLILLAGAALLPVLRALIRRYSRTEILITVP